MSAIFAAIVCPRLSDVGGFVAKAAAAMSTVCGRVVKRRPSHAIVSENIVLAPQ
jgi:hypothetical protein